MNQNNIKLLSYLIDFNGKLKSEYARRIVNNSTITSEFFREYSIKDDAFRSTGQSVLYDFVQEYYEQYQAPPTIEVITSELLCNRGLGLVRKEEIRELLTLINQNPPNYANYEYVVDSVIEQYISNKVMSVVQTTVHTIKEDAVAGVEYAMRELSGIRNLQREKELPIDKSLSLSQFAEFLETEFNKTGSIVGELIPYPYPEFNNILGGMVPGELIVIAGLEGTGKSFMGRDIAYEVAFGHNKRVVFADREMQHHQSGVRFLSRMTGIPARKLRNSRYQSKEERRVIKEALKEFKSYTEEEDNILFLPPKRCENTRMIQREVDLHWGGKPPEFLVADYLTEFLPSRKVEGWESVRQITHDLRQFGLTNNCPVVTMSQLNEKGDLQYRTIRHIADTIITIREHPEFPYEKPGPGEFIGKPGIIECNIRKARNEAGSATLYLEVEFATASVRGVSDIESTRIAHDSLRDDPYYD